MKIKSIFTIPEGKTITEAMFIRVMLASLCSIFLCMTCLAGATWAWFTVSLENTGNVVEIATVTVNTKILHNGEKVEQSEDGCYQLEKGNYEVTMSLTSNAQEPTYMRVASDAVYVVISVRNGENVRCYYQTFENRSAVETGYLSVPEESAVVSFAVSWVKPVAATPISQTEEIIPVGIADTPTEVPAEAQQETATVPTEEPGEPSE